MKAQKLLHYTIPVFFPQLACPLRIVFGQQERIT
jgi:hypothetical protein